MQLAGEPGPLDLGGTPARAGRRIATNPSAEIRSCPGTYTLEIDESEQARTRAASRMTWARPSTPIRAHPRQLTGSVEL